MRYAILITFLAALAGCAAPPTAGVGFTGIGNEPVAAQSGEMRFAAPQRSGSPRMAARVPSFSIASTNARMGRGALTMPEMAARNAIAYKSHDWGSGSSVPVSAGDSSGRLRLVTVDGHSFAVVGKIRQPAFRETRTDALADMMAGTVPAMTGCSATGPVSFASGRYGTVQRMAFHVTC